VTAVFAALGGNDGVLERWSDGVLEFWSFGVLEWGKLEARSWILDAGLDEVTGRCGQ